MSHDATIIDLLVSGLGLAFGVWLFYRALQRSESPLKIISKLLFSTALMAVVVFIVHKTVGSLQGGSLLSNAGPVMLAIGAIAVAGVLLSVFWTRDISDFLSSPLTDLFDGGKEPPEARPAYSTALSKRNRKRPLEAVVAIREQLARFPNDFTGVMLLATIQAEDLEDLPGAEITLTRFFDSPGVPQPQAVKALTQLAEWHINSGSDPDTILEIMEKLIARFPEAKISRRMAERLGRLNAGAEKQEGISAANVTIPVEQVVKKHVSRFRPRRPE